MNRTTPALEVDNLTVRYGTNLILDSLSLVIQPGELVGIVGPNGAGKSTLVKAILNLIPITGGSIKIFGNSIKDKKTICAYVPQRASIDWHFPLSVFEVVLMGCYARLGWFKRPTPGDKDQAMQALREVGMQDYAHQAIGALSGGQQQRVFLARALLQNTPLMILDEPCNGIDAYTQEIIMLLLKKLTAEGKTVLVVHHDLSRVINTFSHVILLNKTLIASGPTQEVFTAPLLEKAFGIPLAYVCEN